MVSMTEVKEGHQGAQLQVFATKAADNFNSEAVTKITVDHKDQDDLNEGAEYSDDDVVDQDAIGQQGPRTPSEKHTLENAFFQAYADKISARRTKEEIKEVLKVERDESLSIKELLAKQESSVRITTPRDYQIELFEKSQANNIIAVLDTGSGKTHIGTLLLRWTLDQEVERRTLGEPPKTAFFLVNSVNLVFQQSDYLSCNLDHPCEGICGAHGANLWSRSTWTKHLEANKVIVCTADVLDQCLMHSFIRIDQINLLIFDEAHHAKPGSNHPYAKIMKEYYMQEPNEKARPRIFGMTASPVDANDDVVQAAKDLESLLHCQIMTTSNLDLLRNSIHKPKEHVAKFDRLRPPFDTPLHQQLKQKFGSIHNFDKLSEVAKLMSSQLGSWCSDVYWSFAFAEEEARKLENRENRKFASKGDEGVMAEYDAKIAILKKAKQVVAGYDYGIPSVNLHHVSSKVLELHSWLQKYYERPTDSKCIVFTERRCTARLLHLLFSHIGSEHLKCGRLIGSGNGNLGNMKSTLREQFLTISDFRKGKLNCLFATAVGEEGLDIPDCNLIVRFDLYKTMIQYVQSRGRARKPNSVFLHMVEKGNYTQSEIVMQSRQAEDCMRAFCNSLPEDRLLDKNNEALEDALRKERALRSYVDPKSGAKLTYRSSLAVVSHFVDCLPKTHDIDSEAQPIYNMSIDQGKFVCEVMLPGNSPVKTATGKPYSKKILAKCSAAFEACILLRKGQFLDESLLPIYGKVLPAMRNAKLALDMNKKNRYPIKVKPDFWAMERGICPTTLFLTTLDATEGLERPHKPIGILSRQRMPQLPQFPIFLDSGKRTDIISQASSVEIAISEADAEALTAFTLRIYEDVFAKKFEHDPKKMSYWMVPLNDTFKANTSICPAELIDWGPIHESIHSQDYKWTKDTPDDFLRDRFFVDEWDGGRRYYSLDIAPNVRPADEVPQIKKGAKKIQGSIIDYTVSMFKKSKDYFRSQWDMDQPVLKAERTSFRRNFLAAPNEKELDSAANKHVYICPQPLKISVIPTTMVVFCYVIPAIMYRFDSYLIALETGSLLGLDIGPELALEAVTKDSDNNGEHDSEKINFRRGMGNNYERLEFIGDCFLKMAASVALFVQNPDDNEFHSHVNRMTMTSNQNLFNTSLALRLPEYVRSLAFSRRLWYPEAITLLAGRGFNRGFLSEASTEPTEQVQTHSLGDKTVADVSEAIIGAAFLQHSDPKKFVGKNWDNAVKAVTKLAPSEYHKMTNWDDYYAMYTKPAYQIAEATASQRDMAEKVEKKHDYHFKYPRLLRSAFIHPSQSFMIEHVPDYERLEFLGDSLLDMVFISDIFYRYPDKDPQWLTEHKMPMVSNKFLATLCVDLNFHPHLRRNTSKLDSNIKVWVDEITELKLNSHGEADYWTAAREPPKCLADMVEAYVAAIFVDSGFDFTEVQRFYDQHIRHFFEDMTIYDAFAKSHPMTRLRSLLKVDLGCHDHRMQVLKVETVIPGAKEQVVAMVMVHGKIIADSVGESGRYAKTRASIAALTRLDGLPPFEYRIQYGCNCMQEDEADPVPINEVGQDVNGAVLTNGHG